MREPIIANSSPAVEQWRCATFMRGISDHIRESLAAPPAVQRFIEKRMAGIEMLAPGTVAVPSLGYASLILDPFVHCVLVRRPEWIASTGAEIEEGFKRIVESCGFQFGPHYYWEPHKNPVTLREGLRGNFPYGAFHSSFDDFWKVFVSDTLRLRLNLEAVTGGKELVSRCRFSAALETLPAHVDSQCITYSCTYFGGPPEGRMLNGQILSPRRGEVAIWKGEMYNDPVYHPVSGELLRDGDESPLNSGQGFLHWAPTAPQAFPRYTMIHDVQDLIIPERVRPALMPWM